MMESLFPDYRPSERTKTGKVRCRVRVLHPCAVVEVDAGSLLIDALREAGVDVPQQCGGLAICSWCRMRVMEGEENLSPMGSAERRLLDWGKLRINERASCQAEVLGDVVVVCP